ncbi:protein artemis-like isoform X2 [Dysidea avara]|uniref:protein artemis-like isoform X2 n=1 Tax=Dysidea avara TaxID=196820 RepID=UPI0033216F1A
MLCYVHQSTDCFFSCPCTEGNETIWDCSLYCSEVTKALLQVDEEFAHLVPYLKSLPIEETVLLSLPAHMHLKPLQVTVTLLPAGHCPGSVMFLLQDGTYSVLYTGDFRLQAEDIKHIPILHSSGRLLELDSVYLDTTFCHPKAANIPTREESRDVVLSLMDEWLNKSDRHVVHLNLFMFGFEHVILGVAEKFHTKVHVSGNKVRGYNEMTAVGDCVTADGTKTRVHACVPMKGKRYGSGVPCGAFTNEKEGYPKVMKIKLSAQWFFMQPSVPKSTCVHLPRLNLYRVFHSMHASYSEIRSFVGYLRPKAIVPCVTALNDNHPMDVCDRLKDLLQTGHHTDVGTQPSDCFGDQVTDVLPNKDTPDHTHWVSGDDTDSDWASPVHHNDNANHKLFPQQTTKTRKCPSTKRSLFSSQGDSSLEQLELCSVKKYNGACADDSDSDQQTSIELSYPLSDIGNNDDAIPCNFQPHPPAPATPTTSINTFATKSHHTSPRPPLTSTPLKACCEDEHIDVIDLTESDDDSDVTYCSSGEDDDVYVTHTASLSPTATSCHHNSSPPSLHDHFVLPATPEHNTPRAGSIVLSYRGTL